MLCAWRARRPPLRRDSLGSRTQVGIAMARDAIDLVVLDTIADDVESLDTILARLNHPKFGWRELRAGGDFCRDDIIPPLLRLIRAGLAEAYRRLMGGEVLGAVVILPRVPTAEDWAAAEKLASSRAE